MIRLSAILCILLSLQAIAQEGWNWPSNPDDSAAMVERHTMYTDGMRLGDYNISRKPLQWIIARQPDLHPSIYQHGTKIYESLSEEVTDQDLKMKYQDSALVMYKLRAENFEDEVNAVYDRYPYTYYRYYYKDISRYAEIRQLFDKAFEILGNDISMYNLSAYMNLMNYYYRYKPEEAPQEDVLNAYDKINEILIYKAGAGVSDDEIAKVQERIDAILVNSGIQLTCDQIEERYVKKFRETKTAEAAKKVIAYSLQYKCTTSDFFIEAASVLLESEPSASLAKTIADRYVVNKNFNKAIEFYNKSLELEQDNLKRAEAYYKIAQVYVIQDQKVTARQIARKAISEDPSFRDAYGLIGNLYFNSFNDCKKGESKIADYSVYIAAYEMYAKAGDTEKMEAAKAFFPTKEDLFSEDLYDGDSYEVGCWINETITLRARD